MRPQHSASLHPNEPLDIREIGAPTPDGNPQTSSRRLFLQLHAFAGSPQPEALVEALSASSLESVLYEDLNDPTGVAVLLIAKDPADVVVEGRELFVSQPFSELRPKPELTMIGRTYSTGREPDLEDWLLVKAASERSQSGTPLGNLVSITPQTGVLPPPAARPRENPCGARHDGACLCRSRLRQRYPFSLLWTRPA